MSYQNDSCATQEPEFLAEEPQFLTKEPGKPVASLVLGIFGLLAWLIPLFGFPVTITGLVFGIRALPRKQNGMAVAGTVLCTLGLVLTAVNSALGAYLAVAERL